MNHARLFFALASSLLACVACHSDASNHSPSNAGQLLLGHTPQLEDDACPEIVGPTAHCGFATVPADWTRPDADTLRIWYALLPAPSGHATRTVIPFMGGPGETISGVADRFIAGLPQAPDQALLIVDVRGVGRSSRLRCPALDDLSFMPYGDAQIEAFGACGDQLGEQRNHFTTAASVLDIEAIRRALELPKPALFGVSYGTWVAQVYTILFPDIVQAAVLDGAFPLDLEPFGAVYPTSFAGVLELRCARSGACDASVESARIRQLAAALAAEPVAIEGTDLLLTEGLFASLTHMLLGRDEVGDYLRAVQAASDGDYTALIELSTLAFSMSEPNPIGDSNALAVAVSCNDYSAPFDLADDVETRRAELDTRLAALPQDAFGWFSKRGWLETRWEQGDSCLKWPAPQIPAELRAPYDGPYPAVPVLIVHGDIDLNTPLAGAEQVAGLFPRSVLLQIEDAGHVAIQYSECAREAENEFLRTLKLPAADACAGSSGP